jgi:hypothetical protein
VEVEPGQITARAPNDVYASASYKAPEGRAKPYLAHFDGEKWTVMPVPARRAALTSAAIAPDGTLWVTLNDAPNAARAIDRDGELWRFSSKDRRWREVRLPLPAATGAPEGRWRFQPVDGRYRRMPAATTTYAPAEVWLGAEGDVWVSAVYLEGDDENWTLFRSIPPPDRPLSFTEPIARVSPATVACKNTFFLPIGPLPANVSLDSDFPALRSTLAGHAEIEGTEILETIHRGERFLGLFTSNPSAAAALPALLKKPTLRPSCSAPIATRVVRFRAESGDLLEE